MKLQLLFIFCFIVCITELQAQQRDTLSVERLKLEGTQDISRILEGRYPGLLIRNTNSTLGSMPEILIRQVNSLCLSAKPLWIIDGVIIDELPTPDSYSLHSGNLETLIASQVPDLNIDDIESIEILKGSQATAIYGNQATGGVILLHTKRAASSPLRINYSGEFSGRMKPDYGSLQVMNSLEQVQFFTEMENYGHLTYVSVSNSSDRGIYGQMYNLLIHADPEAKQEYLHNAAMRNTNWFDLLFRNTVKSMHSLNFSSGNNKYNIYASASLLEDPGWSYNSYVNRLTVHLRTQWNITPDVKIVFGGALSNRKQHAPGTFNLKERDVDGYRAHEINPFIFAMTTSRTLNPDEPFTRNSIDFNIFEELENNRSHLRRVNRRLHGHASWDITPHWQLAFLAAYNFQEATTRHYLNEQSNWSGSRIIPSSIEEKGLFKDSYRAENMQLRPVVSGEYIFGTNHRLSFTAGMEYHKINRRKKHIDIAGSNFNVDESLEALLERIHKKEATGMYSYLLEDTTNKGFFGTINYTGKETYTILASFRADHKKYDSYRSADKWLPAWNATMIWNLHHESFFSSCRRVVDMLSVRLSYGESHLFGINFSGNSLFPILDDQDSPHVIAINKAEKRQEINPGIDFSAANNRLGISIDYYHRKFSNLMAPDYRSVYTSENATMKSYGWEIQLNSCNIATSNFQWHTDFSFTTGKNKITRLKNGIPQSLGKVLAKEGCFREGHPAYALFALPFYKLSQTGVPIFYSNIEEEEKSLEINFGDGATNQNIVYAGNTRPTTYGSLNNSLSFKGVTFDILLTYAWGHKTRTYPWYQTRFNDVSNQPKALNHRWKEPGDEETTSIPSAPNWLIPYATNNLAHNYSDINVKNNSHIRLKEVAVAYSLPKEWLSHLKLQHLELKINASNLALLYTKNKENGSDLDYNLTGGVALPAPRQFTFTLKVGI